MIDRIEIIYKKLLASNIPVSQLVNLNVMDACPVIVRKYEEKFNVITGAMFKLYYDPNSGHQIFDIHGIPGNFKINDKAILILDNITIPLASRVVITLGPKFIYGSRVSETQIDDLKSLTDSLNHGLQAGIIELIKFKTKLNFHLPRHYFYDKTTAFLRQCLYIHNIFMDNNPDIMLINSDKGAISAVMTRHT